MHRCALVIATTLFIGLLPAPAQAEVKIATERIENNADAQFRFRNVPAPSKTDAAANARLRIVGGREDDNSAGLDTLIDGELPLADDHPAASFFFDAGTAGGRIVMDLGRATEVQQINTYSWHHGSRGPQVYRLYASKAVGNDLPTVPVAAAELEKADWIRFATVDTRPQKGEVSGQYGVSITPRAGKNLGTFRYLLFDVAPTSETDRFSNTFFSEIDVIDGREHAAASEPADVQFVFDTVQMPDLAPWVDAKLRPACVKWYPIIARMLPSAGYRPPRHVTITIHKELPVPAATLGAHVHCNGKWLVANREGEAVGAVIHELVHVVQRYGRVAGGHPNPGWLVEGLADYVRWFHFEPKTLRPRPDPARAKYTDGYRATAAFLDYVTEKHNRNLVPKLNEAMRAGRYRNALWKEQTGQDVEPLWAEYIKTLQPK